MSEQIKVKNYLERPLDELLDQSQPSVNKRKTGSSETEPDEKRIKGNLSKTKKALNKLKTTVTDIAIRNSGSLQEKLQKRRKKKQKEKEDRFVKNQIKKLERYHDNKAGGKRKKRRKTKRKTKRKKSRKRRRKTKRRRR